MAHGDATGRTDSLDRVLGAPAGPSPNVTLLAAEFLSGIPAVLLGVVWSWTNPGLSGHLVVLL